MLIFPGVGRATCSFGVTGVREDETPEALIQRADVALYLAKKSGRNRVECE